MHQFSFPTTAFSRHDVAVPGFPLNDDARDDGISLDSLRLYQPSECLINRTREGERCVPQMLQYLP